MKQELNQYCLDHKLTTYEVFCKAYAAFLNRPLVVREYGKMHEQSREYLRQGNNADPPHFVKFFLINERRERRRQHSLPLDL